MKLKDWVVIGAVSLSSFFSFLSYTEARKQKRLAVVGVAIGICSIILAFGLTVFSTEIRAFFGMPIAR